MRTRQLMLGLILVRFKLKKRNEREKEFSAASRREEGKICPLPCQTLFLKEERMKSGNERAFKHTFARSLSTFPFFFQGADKERLMAADR